jgi:hypothetical protein
MQDESSAAAIAETGPESGISSEDERSSTEEPTEDLLRRLEQAEGYIDTLKGEKGELNATLMQTKADMAELKGRVDEQSRHAAPEAESEREKSLFELTEEEMEDLNNEPSSVIPLMKQMWDKINERENALIHNVGDYLDELVKNFDGKIGSVDQKLKESDPAIAPWKTAADTLAEKEEFKDLPLSTRIAMAKEMKMAPDYEPQGAPGGRRIPASNGSGRKVSEEDKQRWFGTFMRMTGNNETRAKKMVDERAAREGAAIA